jgi:hypothetical protein
MVLELISFKVMTFRDLESGMQVAVLCNIRSWWASGQSGSGGACGRVLQQKVGHIVWQCDTPVVKSHKTWSATATTRFSNQGVLECAVLVQVIAYFAGLHASGMWRPSLVVAPATMLRQWMTELRTWCA